MKSVQKSKEYNVTLRTVIKITAIDVNTAYEGLEDLLNKMKTNEQGRFVKKLFKMDAI